MNLFNLSLQLNGYPIGKAKKHLKSVQNLLDQTDYIEGKKQEILRHHLENNPYYKALVKDVRVKAWNEIPIMTKKDLQVPLSERLSNGYSTKNIYVSKTSGSSGDPFVYGKDKWCHALTWAIIQDRFSWFGINFNNSKQLRFYGIPLDKKGYIKERLKDWFSNRVRFPIFDLSDMAFEKVVEVCRKTNFEYINGYTSALVQFAKYLDRKNVYLNKFCPSLKVCMATSEMLYDSDKQLMELRFGVPIVNEYGVSELDLVAFQNPKGGFQLNNETLYIEVVDDNGYLLPNGKEGRIIITSLYNKSHPFIRYDVGDIGIISKDGRSLKKLTGRSDDVILLPSGKRAAGLTFYYVTKSIIEDDGVVKEFVIEQFDLDKFVVSYVSSIKLSTEKILFIKKEIETYLEPGIDVTFERVQKINRSRSGKLKQFKSHLKFNSTQVV